MFYSAGNEGFWICGFCAYRIPQGESLAVPQDCPRCNNEDGFIERILQENRDAVVDADIGQFAPGQMVWVRYLDVDVPDYAKYDGEGIFECYPSGEEDARLTEEYGESHCWVEICDEVSGIEQCLFPVRCVFSSKTKQCSKTKQ